MSHRLETSWLLRFFSEIGENINFKKYLETNFINKYSFPIFSLSAAKLVLHEVLSQWRYNGFALVHYGFVLKNLDQDYENAVLYLREGIETNEEGTQDGRFYFNLGDALQRLGRNEEAQEVSLIY